MTDQQQTRPPDVDTGFWLWAAALPLMVIGYLVNVVAARTQPPPTIELAIWVVFVLVISVIVLTFLVLMRQGYRWARTLLTGGGFASVIYVATNLFTAERNTAAAVIYAVTAIVGSVLVIGGIYLLHRKDAHGYFIR